MRLRDRFRKEGCDLDHFEPHNTLELLLFYCAPQKDTNELAHLLIDEFGSISGVFDASYEELIKVIDNACEKLGISLGGSQKNAAGKLDR